MNETQQVADSLASSVRLHTRQPFWNVFSSPCNVCMSILMTTSITAGRLLTALCPNQAWIYTTFGAPATKNGTDQASLSLCIIFILFVDVPQTSTLSHNQRMNDVFMLSSKNEINQNDNPQTSKQHSSWDACLIPTWGCDDDDDDVIGRSGCG